MAISNVRKSQRGRPRIDATPLTVRMPPDDLAPLDAWIATQDDPKLSRPEAIRFILRDWLIGHGLLKHREDPEGAN